MQKLILDKYRDALTQAVASANCKVSSTDAQVTSSMEPAAYSVTVTENTLLVRAGHYVSLEAAILEILSGKGLDGVSFTGVYDGEVPLTDGDMVLVWNDEFDGCELDPAKWVLKAKMSQGDIRNGNDEHNVAVTDGNLLLRAWREDDPEKPYSTNTSVTTDGTFSYKYGYLEMSAVVPYEIGAWPSFWLLGSDLHKISDYRAEVDVIEVFGSTIKGESCLHKSISTPSWVNYSIGAVRTESDREYRIPLDKLGTLKTDYHRYGFGWTPTEMYFTLDGEVYFSHDITESGNFGEGDMSCFHDPLYIIFNNFLFTEGSSWKPSLVTSETQFPIEYRIDWVRLYQTPGVGELHCDASN